MKILITGSSGFIGSNLKEYFRDKYEVLSPTHEELDLTNELDVREYILFNKPEYILHAAHVGRYNQYVPDAVEKNLRMNVNLLRMQEHYKRIIYFGSGAVYGKNRSLNMVSEQSIGNYIPEDQYGFSKLTTLGSVNEQKNAIGLLLFGVYGENEGIERFPSYAVDSVIHENQIVIRKNAWFDYLYIGDLCKIVAYILKCKNPPQLLNVGTGSPVELVEIAKKVKEISRSQSTVFIAEDGTANAYTCDNSRLRSILPKFKFTSIDEGLQKLYEYYKMEGKN